MLLRLFLKYILYIDVLQFSVSAACVFARLLTVDIVFSPCSFIRLAGYVLPWSSLTCVCIDMVGLVESSV